MSFKFLEPAPLEQQIKDGLGRISAGESPSNVSTAQVVFKEELGRTAADGSVLAGEVHNEIAAGDLARCIASMANSPGGGAIVLGIGDGGELIGTEIDEQWLRERIWELTERKLAADVRPAELEGCRLLVLTTHEAVEEIPYRGELLHRVGSRDVKMDATTRESIRLNRSGLDWSALPSIHPLESVGGAALEAARRHLSEQDDEASASLATTHDSDLLRRLGLTDGHGRLTNAGALLFIGTQEPGIDYIRRESQSGDSRHRTRSTNPLVMQIHEVEVAAAAANPIHHIDLGFVHRQVESVPVRALREAIVNGVTHRDWLSPHPTVVEHVAATVTVTSPGGFIDGIEPTNIITHPARPRYRALAEAMMKLRLAEREGVGVARMVRDMLSLGRPAPEITESSGPSVRVVLMGGDPDTALVHLLSRIDPEEVAGSVDTALLLDHLCRIGWVDRFTASVTLQRGEGQSANILEDLADALILDAARDQLARRFKGEVDSEREPRLVAQPMRLGFRVIERVVGTPASQPAAWMLSAWARAHLRHRLRRHTAIDGQLSLALSYAKARGRISSTEAASLLDTSVPTALTRLKTLVEQEQLVSSNNAVGGRGHHYMPVANARLQR